MPFSGELTPYPEIKHVGVAIREVMFAPYRAAYKGNLKTVETFSICIHSFIYVAMTKISNPPFHNRGA